METLIRVVVPIFTFAFLYSSLPTTQERRVGLVGLEVDVEIEQHRSHGTIAFSTGVSSVRLNSCFDVNIDSGSVRTSTASPRQCRERIGRRDRSNIKQTRPDTRPPVADGWAGAEMRVFPLFDSITSTDRPTDRPTD